MGNHLQQIWPKTNTWQMSPNSTFSFITCHSYSHRLTKYYTTSHTQACHALHNHTTISSRQTCIEKSKWNELINSRQAIVTRPRGEWTLASIHLGVQWVYSTTEVQTPSWHRTEEAWGSTVCSQAGYPSENTPFCTVCAGRDWTCSHRAWWWWHRSWGWSQ